MSRPSAQHAVIKSANMAPQSTPAIKTTELLPNTAKVSGKIMCVLVPCNGSPPNREPIFLMNICDEAGIEHYWPDARYYWGTEPLRHTRALLVPWYDNMRRFANGLYFVFGGNVHSRMPVNKHFARNRYGLHGDVIILKPILDFHSADYKVRYKNVPEELGYSATMAGYDMP